MTAHERVDPSDRYRLRIADYLLLDRQGAFAGARTELLNGDVVLMNAEFRPHAYAKTELGYAIREALRASGSELAVLLDVSVELTPHDAPRPDIVVTRQPLGEGMTPRETVALIVEVASSTLAKDLNVKRAIYAAAAIPEYWVVDLGARVLHQFGRPVGDTYRERRKTALGGRVEAITISGLTVATPSAGQV